MRPTAVHGETKGQLVRRGLLRILRADWTDWREVIEIGTTTGWDRDLVEWMQVALREAIALGDVERGTDPHGNLVRLTDHGLKSQAIAALEAVEVTDG